MGDYMKKILFLIHDLGQGGAEKVLINLVNNMDHTKFDVTVMTLFDCGENKQFLSKDITYKTWCKKMVRGNSHLMKLLTPSQLHNLVIKEYYDVEIAYLEGPCARVISGCQNKKTKLVSWIHIEQHTSKRAARSFRSIEESRKCYTRFNKIISVSKSVEQDFKKALSVNADYEVLYNTNESKKIKEMSNETENQILNQDVIKMIGVGKLLKNKGFDRLLKIVKRLKKNGLNTHLYILGDGPERGNLEEYCRNNDLIDNVTLLGYQLNPYKFIKKCDLFVCASLAEGFSTAATEALILGIPVCTVEVSGMKEMLGENNEYGIVVANEDIELYKAIKDLVKNPEKILYYKQQAEFRGNYFSIEGTVKKVEEMIENL